MDSSDQAPKNVGESMTESGEDVAERSDEPGRHDAGTQGESERPVGDSTARDSTGVDPKEVIDPAMPHLPTP